MYWQRPTAADCGPGVKPEDFPEPKVELWEENKPALDLFRDYKTQWRVGPGGAVGLDYAVIFHELDRRNLGAEAYDEAMYWLRVAESAALDQIHKE